MLSTDLLAHVPKPLLADLVRGRWLPLVGAGFSKNAVVPGGPKPLDWRELGTALAADVPDASADAPLEAISSYGHAYGRVALISKVSELLRIQDAVPGAAHAAFAKLTFERVVTTNFDLLLERAYDRAGRPCLPLLEESQLSGANPYLGPSLLKLHGDVHHPRRMVLTEDDYDNFLGDHPVLATHLAAQLINNTAVLIGYSLDDPDTRQILALLRNRLGGLARPLWAVQVAAPAHVISRFQRRGVHVINLPLDQGATYEGVLAALFNQLAAYWQGGVLEASHSTDERTLADLRLPASSSNTCYFAVPLDLVPWYRDTLHPLVEEMGMVPVFARDVVTPEGTSAAKIEALIHRARAVIVDISSPASLYEAAVSQGTKPPGTVLLVQAESAMQPFDIGDRVVLRRPDDLTSGTESFVAQVRSWLLGLVKSGTAGDAGEADRLLAAGEARAALVAAVALLERRLAAHLDVGASDRRPVSISRMLAQAEAAGYLGDSSRENIQAALRIRNEALHLGREVTIEEAQQAVLVVKELLRQLSQPTPTSASSPT